MHEGLGAKMEERRTRKERTERVTATSAQEPSTTNLSSPAHPRETHPTLSEATSGFWQELILRAVSARICINI